MSRSRRTRTSNDATVMHSNGDLPISAGITGDAGSSGESGFEALELVLQALLDPLVILRAIRDAGHRIIDFAIVEANEPAVVYNGTFRQELIGSRLLERYPNQAGSGLFQKYVHTMETGETLVLDDFIYGASGSRRERRLNIRVVRVGEFLGYTWRDITQRDQLLEDFRLLAENVSNIVFRLGPDLNFEWLSPSIEQTLGYTPEELIGTNLFDFCHPDDDAMMKALLELPGNDIRGGIELRVRRADGQFAWLSVSGRRIIDSNQQLIGYVGSGREVQREHDIRQALEESEARYRLLAENSSDVVSVGDAGGRLKWVSDAVTTLLGWKLEDLSGTLFHDLIHPADLGAYEELGGILDDVGHRIYTVRLRTSSGAYRWVSISVHQVSGADGELPTRVATWRDASQEVANRRELEESQQRFRLLAENASDVVWQSDLSGHLVWVSPSAESVLGWPIPDLVGTNASDLVVEDDRSKSMEWWTLATLGEHDQSHEFRYRTAGGESLWMSVNAKLVRGDHDGVESVIVSLRNIQSEVIVRRAMTTLSAGSREMVRADHEDRLLSRMCEVTVEEGGYLLAWYGRKINDAEHSVRILANSRGHLNYLENLTVSWADEPLGHGPTGTAIRTEATVVINDFRSAVGFVPWLEAALANGMYSSIALPVRLDGVVDGALTVYAAELNAFDSLAQSVLEDLASELGHGMKRLREEAKLVQSLRDTQLLTSAVDQAGDAIVVSDPLLNIVYANPATSRSSGYSHDELIGANPRIFQSGLESHEFYEEMWAKLTSGQSWSGVLANRRKNGEIYEEDTTISPIHDDDQTLVAYVAVKHDLTKQRRLEADLSREVSDRDTVVELMRAILPFKTIEVTADAFCESATGLTGIDGAAMMLADGAGNLTTVASRGPIAFDSSTGTISIPELRGNAQRVVSGPVLIDLDPELWPSNVQHVNDALAAGIKGVVAAPMRWDGQLIGVLILATKDPVVAAQASGRFAYFEELAAYAGSLVGAQALARLHRDELRDEVMDIIEHRRFHPVFQPFVDLSTNETVGYEALTRFDDGRRPDLRFIDAFEVGLGPDLEAICVTVALEASKKVDPDLFISVNFSPAAILDGHAKRCLGDSGRRIIIELTEHAPIEDYAAVRKALGEMPDIALAVDDAGAGYTSLRHILELKPQYVKLDISIVHNIDIDEARQAMAAGIMHFASHDGTVVIAEGVETESEARKLQSLGVTLGRGLVLGQGYYFAPPEPLD